MREKRLPRMRKKLDKRRRETARERRRRETATERTGSTPEKKRD